MLYSYFRNNLIEAGRDTNMQNQEQSEYFSDSLGKKAMTMIKRLKEKIYRGNEITKEEALLLYEESLEELCQAADEAPKAFLWKCFRYLHNY